MAAYVKLIEEGQVGRVTRMFEGAIATSFETHPMQGGCMTRAEVKSRFDHCDRIFCKLREELKWGLERIEGVLATYLGNELDHKDWAGDAQGARTIWTPGDGA